MQKKNKIQKLGSSELQLWVRVNVFNSFFQSAFLFLKLNEEVGFNYEKKNKCTDLLGFFSEVFLYHMVKMEKDLSDKLIA